MILQFSLKNKLKICFKDKKILIIKKILILQSSEVNAIINYLNNFGILIKKVINPY